MKRFGALPAPARDPFTVQNPVDFTGFPISALPISALTNERNPKPPYTRGPHRNQSPAQPCPAKTASLPSMN